MRRRTPGALFELPSTSSELSRTLAAEVERTIPVGLPYAAARRLMPSVSAPVGTSLVAFVVAILPPAVAPLTGCRGIELLWLSLWALLQLLMTVFALIVWEKALQVSDAVDDLVEPDDRAVLYSWLRGRANARPQAAVTALGIVLGVLVCFPIAHALRGKHLCSMSYVQIVMLSALGCSVVYWNTITTMFSWKLARLERLRVRWSAPARTKGIRMLSRFYGIQTRYAATGAFVFSVPVGWAYVIAGANRLLLIAILLAITCTACAIFSVYWVPQRLLSGVVTREKERALERLRQSVVAELPAPHSGAEWEGVEQRLPALAVILAIEDTEDSVHDFLHSLRVLVEVSIAILGYGVSLLLAHSH